MIDIYLDEHHYTCKREPLNWYCGKPSCLLLFINNKFILVRYHICNHSYSHLDYKEELVNRIFSGSKIHDFFEVRRERWNSSEFLFENKSGLKLRKYVKQINYIYSDNAGRFYAITTKADFFDEVFCQDERIENYYKAKKYLKDNYLEYLLNDLDQLFFANSIPYVSEITVVKTIDNLIKEINNLINE